MQSSAIQPDTRARDRQLRAFVVAWMGITLLMGALAFIGIYYATGTDSNNNNDPGNDVSVMAVPGADLDQTTENLPPADDAPAEPPVEAAPAAVDEAVPAPANDAPAQDTAQDMAQDWGIIGQPDDDTPAMAAPAPEQAGPPAQDATPVPTPSPLPVNNPQFQVGIQVQANPDPEVYRIWMGDVRDKLKLRWIKQQVRWEDVEPAPGQYEWGALDVTFEQAKEYGINVMVSVVTAPEWAREQGAPLDKVGPPADPQTFANFIATMLYRYPGQIQAVEVWNEQNLDREWSSTQGLSAQNYVTLLRTAYETIKMVDPGVIVISGALSPTGLNDGVGAYDDFVFMEMLINARMLDYADCVGAHHNGYNIGPSMPWNNVPNDPSAQFRGPFDNPHHSWSFYSTLNGYHDRIVQAGSDKRLCITEFGWATTEDLNGFPVGFEFANDNTLAEQAQFIGEAIDLMDEWGFVWLAFVWNLNYGAQAGWDATNDNVPYALLRPEWQTAPAYEVIASHNFRGE